MATIYFKNKSTGKYGEIDTGKISFEDANKQLGGSLIQVDAKEAVQFKPEAPRQVSLGRKLLESKGVLPTALALGGGVAAAPFTAGASLPVTLALAGAGAGIGGGAGEALRQALTPKPDSNLKDVIKEGLLGAGGEVTGIGLARGVGAVARGGTGIVGRATGGTKAAAELSTGASKSASNVLEKGLGTPLEDILTKFGTRDVSEIVNPAGRYQGLAFDELKNIGATRKAVSEGYGAKAVAKFEDIFQGADDLIKKYSKSLNTDKAGLISETKSLLNEEAQIFKKGASVEQLTDELTRLNSLLGKRKAELKGLSDAEIAVMSLKRDGIRRVLSDKAPDVIKLTEEYGQLSNQIPVLRQIARSAARPEFAPVAKGGLDPLELLKNIGLIGRKNVADVVTENAVTGATPAGGTFNLAKFLTTEVAKAAANRGLNLLSQPVVADTTTFNPTSPSSVTAPSTESAAPMEGNLSGDTKRVYDNLIQKQLSGGKLTTAETSLLNTLLNQSGARPATAMEKQRGDDATHGLELIGKINQRLAEDPNVLIKASLPGSLGARDYKRWVNDIVDIYTRVRTGAALNEQEIAFYDKQAPALLDFGNPKAQQAAIQNFQDMFERAKVRGSANKLGL